MGKKKSNNKKPSFAEIAAAGKEAAERARMKKRQEFIRTFCDVNPSACVGADVVGMINGAVDCGLFQDMAEVCHVLAKNPNSGLPASKSTVHGILKNGNLIDERHSRAIPVILDAVAEKVNAAKDQGALVVVSSHGKKQAMARHR